MSPNKKTVLNTRGTGRAESTQRQLYVFMALLRVSRLRVSADPQVLNEQKTQILGAGFPIDTGDHGGC